MRRNDLSLRPGYLRGNCGELVTWPTLAGGSAAAGTDKTALSRLDSGL